MEDVQKHFKNCFVVIIGLSDDCLWTEFQMAIEGNNLRLFRVTNVQEAANLTLEFHKEMSQKEKFVMQAEYFQREKGRHVHATTSRNVMMETFQKLNVPESDAQIVIEGFPRMYQIITETKEVLAENSPASYDTIDQLASFFEG